MSIAREIAENIHDFSNLEIIDVPLYRTENKEKEIFSFLDCSVLIIEKEKEKAYVSESKEIRKIRYKTINPENVFFNKTKAILTEIKKDEFNEINKSSLSVLSLSINKDKQIFLGLKAIHILNIGDVYGELASGNKYKELNKKDASFLILNINPELISKVLDKKLTTDLENKPVSINDFINSKIKEKKISFSFNKKALKF